MNAPTETTRTHGLRAGGGTGLGPLERAVRRVAAPDPAPVAAVLLAVLVGYAVAAIPAGLVALLGGLAVAVTLATALPFAVVRAVGALAARAG